MAVDMMGAVNWRRIIGLAVSALVAAGVGWIATKNQYLLAQPVTHAYAERRVHDEVAEAMRIGIDSLAVEQDVPLRAGTDYGAQSWSMPITIRERECVAVVVGAYGSGAVESVSLYDGPSEMTSDFESRGVVAQVQWCALVASTLRVDVNAIRRSDTVAGTPNGLLVHVLRGNWERVGGPEALTRGRPYEHALASLAAAYPEDAFASGANLPDGATPIASGWSISMGTALLLPGNDRTYAALYRANARDAEAPVNPRVEVGTLPEHADLDAGLRARSHRAMDAAATTDASAWDAAGYRASLGFDGSADVHDPVVDLSWNEFRRVLAVVDPAAVGSRCFTVVFHRRIPLFAAEVRAFDLDTWSARDIARFRNTASDDLCPAPAHPVVYIAPDSDQAEYRLDLFVHPPTGAESPR